MTLVDPANEFRQTSASDGLYVTRASSRARSTVAVLFAVLLSSCMMTPACGARVVGPHDCGGTYQFSLFKHPNVGMCHGVSKS